MGVVILPFLKTISHEHKSGHVTPQLNRFLASHCIQNESRTFPQMDKALPSQDPACLSGLISSLCPLPGHSDYWPFFQLPENTKSVPTLWLVHPLSLGLDRSSHGRLFLRVNCQLCSTFGEIFSSTLSKVTSPSYFFHHNYCYLI